MVEHGASNIDAAHKGAEGYFQHQRQQLRLAQMPHASRCTLLLLQEFLHRLCVLFSRPRKCYRVDLLERTRVYDGHLLKQCLALAVMQNALGELQIHKECWRALVPLIILQVQCLTSQSYMSTCMCRGSRIDFCAAINGASSTRIISPALLRKHVIATNALFFSR